MSVNEERALFAKMDLIDEREAIGRLKDIGPSDVQPTAQDRITLAAIRARTFARLGLGETGSGGSVRQREAEQTENVLQDAVVDRQDQPQAAARPAPSERPRSFRGRRALGVAIAAVLLAVALTSAYSASSSEVRAQVRKWLQFIPGFAAVETSEGNAARYILAEPVVQPWQEGSIELRGVSIGEPYSSISIAGSAGPDAKAVTLKNADGQTYVFKYATITRAGEWLGHYYYQGTVRATEEMEVSFDNGAAAMKFRLQPAAGADRIEDLGETSDGGGFPITAVVASAEGAKRRVTLLPQPPAGIRITSYGMADYEAMEKPVLTDGSGKRIDMLRESTFPNPNEFSFMPDSAGADSYRLVLSAVTAVKHADKPVKLSFPVPEEGSLTLNKRIDLLGYPVDIVRVERPSDRPDLVRIYWDMHYDVSAPHSPLLFFPDPGYTGKSGGAGAKTDEATGAMLYMELATTPGEKEHVLYVSDLTLLIRGPWAFDLPLPEASG
jgi:hypothetical protein